MVEGDHNIEREVHVTAGQVQVKMHMTNWSAAQREDPVLNTVLSCLEAQKKTKSEDTPGGACFYQRGPNGVV